MARRIYRQRDGSDHECHGRPGSGPGQGAGRAPRAESRLAALSAKGRGNVAALAALQQNHDDNEETDQDVDGSDEVNHIVWNLSKCVDSVLERCFGAEILDRNFFDPGLQNSWCGRGDLNHSITLIRRNLLILHSA